MAVPPQTTPQFNQGGTVFGRDDAQWNSYFAAKVDAENGTAENLTLINPVINGIGVPTLDGANIWTGTNIWPVRIATGNVTINTGDVGGTVVMTGNTFSTFTVPSAAGFLPGSQIRVINGDASVSSGGRARKPSGITLPSNFPNLLYPGMGFLLTIVSGAWQVSGMPTRFVVPLGGMTYFTDFTNGDDNNDGLAAGTGNAFKTAQRALDTILGFLDINNNDPGVTITMAAGTVDTSGVHWAPHAAIGANGGACITITTNSGSPGTLSKTTGDGVGAAFFQDTEITLQNVIVVGTGGGAGILAQFSAHVYLDNVTFGAAPGAAKIAIAEGAAVDFQSACTDKGDASFFLSNSGGYFNTNGFGLTVAQNETYALAFISANGGITSWGSTTITNAHTVTGQRFSINNGAILVSGPGGAPSTYFPGNTAGAAITPSYYDTTLIGPINFSYLSGTIANSQFAIPAIWTAADNSVDNLAFTSVAGNWVQIGNMVFAYTTLTYPATASTNVASIKGLPVPVPNHFYAATPCVANSTLTGPLLLVPTINGSTAAWLRAGAAVQNVALSGLTISFLLIYPAT